MGPSYLGGGVVRLAAKRTRGLVEYEHVVKLQVCVCVCVCLCLCLCLCLSVWLSVCMSVFVPVCQLTHSLAGVHAAQ